MFYIFRLPWQEGKTTAAGMRNQQLPAGGGYPGGGYPAAGGYVLAGGGTCKETYCPAEDYLLHDCN